MKYRILTVSMLAGVGACQSSPQPATLVDASPETLSALTGVLAAAVDRAQVQLGPGDLTKESVISVLPPRPGPLEGNSPAMPTIFDIVLVEGECFVQERQSGERFPLTGIACTPAAAN